MLKKKNNKLEKNNFKFIFFKKFPKEEDIKIAKEIARKAKLVSFGHNMTDTEKKLK